MKSNLEQAVNVKQLQQLIKEQQYSPEALHSKMLVKIHPSISLHQLAINPVAC